MGLQFYRWLRLGPSFQDADATVMLGSLLWTTLVIAFILYLAGYLTLGRSASSAE